MIRRGVPHFASCGAKSNNCGSPSVIGSTLGKLLGRCFVGDTLVIIGLTDETQAPASPAVEIAGLGADDSHLSEYLAAGCFVVGATGGLILERRRRKLEHQARQQALDALFHADDLLDDDPDDDRPESAQGGARRGTSAAQPWEPGIPNPQNLEGVTLTSAIDRALRLGLTTPTVALVGAPPWGCCSGLMQPADPGLRRALLHSPDSTLG